MKAAAAGKSSSKADRRSDATHEPRTARVLPALLILLFLSTAANASTQLVLRRSNQEHAGTYQGVGDLAIDPGIENARVTVTVDGQKVADGLVSPWHVVVDFGSTALQ